MSIDYDHLRRLVGEMEQDVAATTQYSWLDLARELICLREHIEGVITAMEVKATTGESQSPAIVAGFLKEVVLGETNE